jgi:CHAT domain-containing protein/tetratricopeptide (TPR) repeat protein
VRIGPYEITAQLGVGGIEVCRTTDSILSRQVLPDAFAQYSERLARFEREAKTLAALKHPNIATIRHWWTMCGWIRRRLVAAAVAASLTPLASAAQQATPPDHESSPASQQRLAEATRIRARAVDLYQRGQAREAIALAEQAWQIRRSILGDEHLDTAHSLNDLAAFHHAVGDLSRAEQLLIQAIAVQRKLLGDQPVTATSLSNLGRVYDSLGDWRRAQPLHEEALAIRRNRLGEEHPDTVSSMHNLARTHSSLHDYEHAVPLYEAAIALSRKVLGGEHEETAKSLSGLASVYIARAEYRRAEVLYAEVLATHRKVHGNQHRETAVSLNNLAHLYDALGEWDRAEPLYVEAIAIQRKVLGDEHPHTTTSLHNLASLYSSIGDTARAEAIYLEVLSLRRRILGDGDPDTASTLNGLALLYQSRGEYDRAAQLLEEAVAISRKASGDVHRTTAVFQGNLASLYVWRGDYVGAEALHRQVIATRRKVLGDRHPDTAAGLRELASLYVKLGDFVRAEPLYVEALEIQRMTLGEDHPATATTLHGLAFLYLHNGHTARAVPLLARASAIYRNTLKPEHPNTLTALASIATILAEVGDYDRAQTMHEQLLALRRHFLGEDHPDVSSSLNGLATLHYNRGDFTRAEELYDEAIRLSRKVFGDEHDKTLISLASLAELYTVTGNVERAREVHLEVMEGTRKQLELAAIIQSERQQLGTARLARYRLDNYLSLVTEASLPAHTAWNHVATWKGAILARGRTFRAVGNDPDAAALFAGLQAAASRLASLAAAAPDPKRADAWRIQVAELSNRKEQLEADLARRSAAFRQARERLDSDRFQRLLPVDTVLVDFLEYRHHLIGTREQPRHVRFEQRLIAFVIHRNGLRLIQLGPVTPIANAIATWRATLGNGPKAVAAGSSLRKTIWQPIVTAIGDAKPAHILVSPDGVLSQLPFGALPGQAAGAYLIEEWPVATIPAPQVLSDLLEVPAAGRPDVSVLVLGDVNFDRREAGAQSRQRRASARAARGDDTRFAALAGTRDELTTVESQYRGRFGETGLTSLSRSLATEDAVRREAPRHQFLHFATHGFFAAARFRSALAPSTGATTTRTDLMQDQSVSGYHPGLLSGLVLAGANAPTPEEDGILTAEEVATLNLSGVNLAVLSACETGLGQMAGGEGLLGLQRAFQTAGARTVVATLWKVDDAATRDLIGRFYDNLWNKQMGKLAALRDAQLWMLRTRSRTASRDARGVKPTPGRAAAGGPGSPYYWAAFVLSGDWR